jgi:hypothetical protein
LLVVGTLITVPLFNYADGQAKSQGSNLEGKAQTYQDRANTIRAVNLSLVGGFIVVAAAGIVQAHLAYVPEFHDTKTRELPAESRLAPLVAPIVPLARGEGAATGAVFGLTGTF